MGKKAKVGKSRKDKFYHLAKETGYRARSAFKLLQLNRKYEFLQKSRVCIDLCAAPGGWLQVASRNMPMASVIIGVDLVPIRPIHNVKTFAEDITTDKCRVILKKELLDWKADVVLNDGAPNVGKNWVHDAFAQAELTLSALKLATDVLRKGGWFITKIFRSKDYQALVWVFSQLFKKVFATKPQASRNESAEIYVVCQGYLAPNKLDEKFLDPKYVFKEVLGGEKKKDIMNMKNKKAKPEGYGDDDTTLHYTLNASKLVAKDNHMELLVGCNEIVLDDEKFASHPLTTEEIKILMSDIKVLGKRELKLILKWRLKMRAYLKSLIPKPEEPEVVEEEESEDEEAAMDETVAAQQEEEEKEAKKKRKQVLKEKKKLRDKMNLNMIIPGDEPLQTEDMELFNLKKMKKKLELDGLEAGSMDEGISEDEDEEDMVERANKIAFDRYNDVTDPGIYSDDDVIGSDEENQEEEDEDEEEEEEESNDQDEEDESSHPTSVRNPLVVDLEEKDLIAQRKAALWFDKDAFSSLDMKQDEELELEAARQDYESKGGHVLGTKSKPIKRKQKAVDQEDSSDPESDSEDIKLRRKKQKTHKDKSQNGHINEKGKEENEDLSESESDSDSSDSDDDDNEDIHKTLKHKFATTGNAHVGGAINNSKKDGFEVVPATKPGSKRVVKLSPVELAIGEELIKSSKRRREVIEGSFNKFSGHDEHVPDWFHKDEQRHMLKQLPVTKEQIDAQKERLIAINARPIKKVAEAKARKKRKSVKKLEKVRKKADAVSDTQDVSDKEKWQQIRQIYSKAGLLKKKKESVAYVVAKKGTGRKVSRPAGVRGKFRVVDPRMKKDDRSRKLSEKGSRGKKGKGGPKKR